MERPMTSALKLGNISTRQQRIARLAREDPQRSLLSLAHNIDIFWLQVAYARTRKKGAAGVDGQTAADYEKDLMGNLRSLLDRFKSGQYKAPPVRRTYVPKADGKKRPIGIPTLEDKVLQRAVLMVLEAVYEEDFKSFSYGFRPGRSPHQALGALREGLMDMEGGWALEVDIRNFYEELVHRHLRDFLSRRVRDGVLHRVIGKWLKAGVMEEGVLHHPLQGTPQGGVISPLLANLYLHEVVDKWFEETVRPRLEGPAFMVRFADDLVMVFRSEREAQQVREELTERVAQFGLRLHPEKTRLVPFQRPSWGSKPARDKRPGTLSWLGFTHYWGLSRRGYWVIKKKTESKRLGRALREIQQWCRRHRHYPVSWQRAKLESKLLGHYGYYGVTCNFRSLARFFRMVKRIWRKWLNRRSQRKRMHWERFNNLLRHHPLPKPRIVHSAAKA